eukprot:CAMPEP_0204624404 /NCGR_PEP_ID=MMETSP0717-20131115/10169_1 /ASSEMBLY_ACC=CAM_ASM_000666 /TAXON_ID=230516 /ORGANISM="Chaetoceros curvisetus" /LENGTH=95 /DNA_ID=CAMNT_0051639789 /DNA_START=264 /DNA_END=551 /DNA_ORIENTATION=-
MIEWLQPNAICPTAPPSAVPTSETGTQGPSAPITTPSTKPSNNHVKKKQVKKNQRRKTQRRKTEKDISEYFTVRKKDDDDEPPHTSCDTRETTPD